MSRGPAVDSNSTTWGLVTRQRQGLPRVLTVNRFNLSRRNCYRRSKVLLRHKLLFVNATSSKLAGGGILIRLHFERTFICKFSWKDVVCIEKEYIKSLRKWKTSLHLTTIEIFSFAAPSFHVGLCISARWYQDVIWWIQARRNITDTAPSHFPPWTWKSDIRILMN